MRYITHDNIDQNNPEPNLLKDSIYSDPSKLTSQLSENSHFSVLTLNCQSLNSKFPEIEILLKLFKEKKCTIDCLCLQETWLNENDDLSLLQLEGYTLISLGYSASTHGGVAIYLNKSLSYTLLHSVRSSSWEALFISIIGKKNSLPLIIGNIYRPPNNNNEAILQFTEDITQTLESLHHSQKKWIITGDFNIDLLKINSRPQYLEYFNSLLALGFSPRITFPTRFSENSGSLIDNILCNFNEDLNISKANILTNEISDHQPCILCIPKEFFKDIFSYKDKMDKFIYTNSRANNFNEKIRDDLRDANLMQHLDLNPQSNPNQNYNLLEKTLTNLIQKYTEVKRVRNSKYNNKRSDWISQGIIKSIKFRDNLYFKMRKSHPNSQERQTLKTNLSTYNKILKKNYSHRKNSSLCKNLSPTSRES